MKTVVLRAPAITQSGYGVHSRQVARWLLGLERAGRCKLFTQLLGWGDTSWLISPEKLDGFIGEMMQRAVELPGKCDVSFQVQLPNEWDPGLAWFNVGITAAVETDKCNPEWVQNCNAMQLVIVPSEHTKQTLMASGKVTTPIVVIPESYPDSFREGKTVDLGFDFDTAFNFLVFGQITGSNPENDRKNIFYTLRWITEAFRNDSNVGIVIKTNQGRNTRIDRNLVTTMLTQLLLEVRGKGKGPPVYLVHGDLDDIEVYSLLKHPKIKAMVNLTRGEGFGLPLLEAAAAGLPVIATNWSAHPEFLNKGKWVQVDYEMQEIHPSRVDNRIFMKGTRWAQPSEENFKRRIKKFYESPSIPTQWAKDLSSTLQVSHSFESIALLYDAALKDVL